jgi:hypothetical protein
MRSSLLKFLLFSFSLLGFSCSNKNEVTKIAGLWVSCDLKSDTTCYSLSILASNDSIRQIYGEIEGVVETNLLGVNNNNYAILDTIPNHFEAHYPSDSYDLAFDLSLLHDTLIQVLNDKIIVKYVRADLAKSYQYLLFSDSELHLQIPLWRNEFNRINVGRKSLLTHIYVGKFKKSIISKYPAINLDSIAIQVDDIFIEIEDIPKWLNGQKDLLPEAMRDSLRVMVVADRDVPEKFLKHLGQALKENCTSKLIGRVYIDWTLRKLHYRKSDPSLF